MTSEMKQLSTRLLQKMRQDQQNLALNYCYDIREAIVPYLAQVSASDISFLQEITYPELLSWLTDKNATRLDPLVRLILISCQSVKYVEYHLPHVKSPSLKAILRTCFSPETIFDLEYINPELQVLADIFNNLTRSSRPNLQCYDCGTSSRGVFYNLIKTHRKGGFHLSKSEIEQFRKNYFYQYQTPLASLNALIHKLRLIERNGVILISIKFGDNLFGHIFIIEKIFLSRSPIYRIYQSALNSFLLIDYLTSVKYLENETLGFSLPEFHSDLQKMISVPRWTRAEELLFVKWFAFYPQDTINDTSNIRFNHAEILY